MIINCFPSGDNLPKQKFSPDMLQRDRINSKKGKKMKKDKFLQKLMDLCFDLQLSVRVNHKDGRINLYEDMGEWECAEQALLYLNKMIVEKK